MLKYGEYTWSQAKKKFSSPIGHSGAHCCKLRTTFGFSRTDNCNKIYIAMKPCHIHIALATFFPVSADALTTVPRLPIYKLLIFDNNKMNNLIV